MLSSALSRSNQMITAIENRLPAIEKVNCAACAIAVTYMSPASTLARTILKGFALGILTFNTKEDVRKSREKSFTKYTSASKPISWSIARIAGCALVYGLCARIYTINRWTALFAYVIVATNAPADSYLAKRILLKEGDDGVINTTTAARRVGNLLLVASNVALILANINPVIVMTTAAVLATSTEIAIAKCFAKAVAA